jgi:serine/threonine-protein kinase
MLTTMAGLSPERTVGRYAIHGMIAAGGMGVVHFGRLLGAAGFVKTVAVKRLHPHFAKDERFVEMFVNEARFAARIRHPNVVQTLDVVVEESDVLLVMEYIHGLTLSAVSRALNASSDPEQRRMPLPIALAIFSNVLAGLHAAHEAVDENGKKLEIIHRDVSPQNIVLDIDGIARVLDFGIAKAVTTTQTSGLHLKGKIAYMAPEQLVAGLRTDRRIDIYAVGAVLWEVIVGRRLFEVEDPGQLLFLVTNGAIRPPRTLQPSVPKPLEDVILRALDTDPAARFATALEMAAELQACGRVATSLEVSQWLRSIGGPSLELQRQALARVERGLDADFVAGTTAVGDDEVTPVTRPSRRAKTTETAPPPFEAPVGYVSSADTPPRRARTKRAGSVLLKAAGLVFVAAVGVGIYSLRMTPPALTAAAPPASVAPPASASASASAGAVHAEAPPASVTHGPARLRRPEGSPRPGARAPTRRNVLGDGGLIDRWD